MSAPMPQRSISPLEAEIAFARGAAMINPLLVPPPRLWNASDGVLVPIEFLRPNSPQARAGYKFVRMCEPDSRRPKADGEVLP